MSAHRGESVHARRGSARRLADRAAWDYRSVVRGTRPREVSTIARAAADAVSSASLEVESTAVLLALSGPQSALLEELSQRSGAAVSLRGNVIHLTGDEGDVHLAYRFLCGAAELAGRGHELAKEDVARALRGCARTPPRTSPICSRKRF